MMMQSNNKMVGDDSCCNGGKSRSLSLLALTENDLYLILSYCTDGIIDFETYTQLNLTCKSIYKLLNSQKYWENSPISSTLQRFSTNSYNSNSIHTSIHDSFRYNKMVGDDSCCNGGKSQSSSLLALTENDLYLILSYCTDGIIDFETYTQLNLTCKSIYKLLNSQKYWENSPISSTLQRFSTNSYNSNSIHTSIHDSFSGSSSSFNKAYDISSQILGLNTHSFRCIKKKCAGTEGSCYHVQSKSNGNYYAIKKARVMTVNNINTHEGVPYYMIRELAALQELAHVNLSQVLHISLYKHRLFTLFDYVELTLFDIQNPSYKSLLPPEALKISTHSTKCLMSQLFNATAFCHYKGIIHRNIKPKHVLIVPGNNKDNLLDGATLKLADFALTRILPIEAREFTPGLVTIAYRCPEILLGKKNYTTAVDVWSCGCIYAEMLQGHPLFQTGESEISQLFYIFQLLGTPTERTWNGYSLLPNYQEELFPHWDFNRIYNAVRNGDEEDIELIMKCLYFDPNKRITAADAFYHQAIRSSSQSVTSIAHINQSSLILSEFKHKVASHTSSHSNTGMNTKDDSCIINTIKQMKLLVDLEGSYGSLYDNRKQPVAISQSDRPLLLKFLKRLLLPEIMTYRTLYLTIAIFDVLVHRIGARTNTTVIANTDSSAANSDFVEISHLFSVSDNASLCSICLYIANKCEDVLSIDLKALLDSVLTVTKDHFPPADTRINQIYIKEMVTDQHIQNAVDMEELILNVLNFRLHLPTIFDIVTLLRRAVTEAKADDEKSRIRSVEFLLMYLCEVTVENAELSHTYRPSMIGYCIMEYCMHNYRHLHDYVFDDVFYHVIVDYLCIDQYYSKCDISTCINSIYQLHKVAHSVHGVNNCYYKKLVALSDYDIIKPPADFILKM